VTVLHARKLGRAARRELGGVLPPEEGTEERPYRTLRAAVAASKPGDVIELGPGIWRGSVTISHELTIRGTGTMTEASFIIEAGFTVVGLKMDLPPMRHRNRNERRRANNAKPFISTSTVGVTTLTLLDDEDLES
jgi:hypothetical protein